MAKRARFHDHLDPAYQEWGRKYPRFPGVAECVLLINEHKVRGVVTDIIVFELAEHAGSCLPDLIQAFRDNPSGDVRMFVLMALEIARLPESVEFFGEVLRDGDPRYRPYALRALKDIDTRESRKLLWQATHQEPSAP
jgi:hypothetical protein